MNLDARQLKRYHQVPTTTASESPATLLPADPDTLVLGAGNSGEAVCLRVQALAWNDGRRVMAGGVNNDELAPRAIPVRTPDGSPFSLTLSERLVLGRNHPREQVQHVPLLEQRYRCLLRGIPVFETYPKSGHGGHGHPVISAMDLDLQSDEVLAFLRQMLRQLRDEPPGLAQAGSDWERLRVTVQQQHPTSREKRIVVIGGGSGSMGAAAHPLLPYLIRRVLADLGIESYTLWGVVLGPRAFTGLTPFTHQNFRALMETLEYLTRHGQQRRYLHDVQISMPVPPYDRLFLLDDPSLPGMGNSVTEAEIEQFLDQTALSLSLLLRGTVLHTLASHTANPDGAADARQRDDGQVRSLHTVRGVLAGGDLAALEDLVTAHLEVQIGEKLLERLA
jgi:hypothetical protein